MAEPSDTTGLDPSHDAGREALLSALARHKVSFVLIGGAAIQSHGRIYDTQDIDLAPDTDLSNLLRLAAALEEMDCQLIVDPANRNSWVALPPGYFTPRSLLAANVWNLATSHGQLDLCFAPTGFPGGFEDLAPHASHRLLAGTRLVVLVAALEDVHESKRQANRPKDREYLRQAAAGDTTLPDAS